MRYPLTYGFHSMKPFPVLNSTPNVTEGIFFFFTRATTTSKNTETAQMQKPAAGIRVEFGVVAQTKYPGSATAIQGKASGCSNAVFPPSLSFTWTADDVRSPGLESAAAASKSCEWGRTHTHNKPRVYCADVALVRAAGFRLHLNKGIHPTPLIYSIPWY